MNRAELHFSIVGVQEVESGSLAGLIGVINRRADSHRRCGACVRGAEIKCQTLEGVGAHVVLIYDSYVASWAFGALEIWTVNWVRD